MRTNEVEISWLDQVQNGNVDISMLKRFEKTIIEFINGDIGVEQFVDGVSELDEWAFRLYWGAPQKTNWLNTGQNKKYPIIKETIWTAVMERVRRVLVEKTGLPFVLIQGNKAENGVTGPVAVAVFENGEVKTKDIDTGIALPHPDGYYVPVIAGECKGGHACSTCHDGIWGQAVRMKTQFPHAIQTFITDNNATVGKKVDAITYDEIDYTFCERGENNSEKFAKGGGYNALNVNTFRGAIDHLLQAVEFHSKEYWMTMNPLYKNSGEKYRDQLDECGIWVSATRKMINESLQNH